MKDRLGEENINTQGLKMWIKEYRKAIDIDVEFEDGFISYNKSYNWFKNGKILNSNFKKIIKNPSKHHKKYKKNKNVLNNRIGETNDNENGEKMTIIEYNNATDIIIKFENGCKVHTSYRCFKNREVKNPFFKSVFGVGYKGTGKYKTAINGKNTIQYRNWCNMLQRCYDQSFQQKCPTYKNCMVCDEWLNYQVFAQWYDDNYYDVNNETMALDKDILNKGNKIYSPENCIIVPQNINTLFIKNDANRGDLPIGVYYTDTKVNKYGTKCGNILIKKRKSLGVYPTIKQAFDKYKEYKENHIKEVADFYKDKIPQKLYDAMYNYIVEITD